MLVASAPHHFSIEMGKALRAIAPPDAFYDRRALQCRLVGCFRLSDCHNRGIIGNSIELLVGIKDNTHTSCKFPLSIIV